MRNIVRNLVVVLAVVTIGCSQKTNAPPVAVKPSKQAPSTDKEDSTAMPPTPLIETYQPGAFVHTLSDWTHALKGPEWTIGKRCQVAAQLGLQLDLVSVADQVTVNKYPQVRTMCVMADMGKRLAGEGNYDPFEIGFAHPNLYNRVHSAIEASINHAAKNDIPFVLVFTGMSTDSPPENQIAILIDGFKGVVKLAEEKGVVLVLEMLNTNVHTPWKGHPGYLGDSTTITANIARQVDSPNFGLVFDVYHMQVMGENIQTMIRNHGRLIRYVHVAGAFPLSDEEDAIQRAELHRQGQLIDYPAVMAALKAVCGGPLAYEYVPTTDDTETAIANLKQAMQICGADSN